MNRSTHTRVAHTAAGNPVKRPAALRRSRWLRLSGAAAGLLAMGILLGAHWMTLQTIAWGRMLTGYAREGVSVRTALTKTFGGDHPCPMCQKIDEGRRQERQEQEGKSILHSERIHELLIQERATPVPLPPLATLRLVSFVANLQTQFVFSPPKPPPRACAAIVAATPGRFLRPPGRGGLASLDNREVFGPGAHRTSQHQERNKQQKTA